MGVLNKQEVLCNGKLIVCDFNDLDLSMLFPVDGVTKDNIKNEILMVSLDGKMYVNINADKECRKILLDLLPIIIFMKLADLKKFEMKHKKILKKDFSTLEEGQKGTALVVGNLIPIEKKRRIMEANYYHK